MKVKKGCICLLLRAYDIITCEYNSCKHKAKKTFPVYLMIIGLYEIDYFFKRKVMRWFMKIHNINPCTCTSVFLNAIALARNQGWYFLFIHRIIDILFFAIVWIWCSRIFLVSVLHFLEVMDYVTHRPMVNTLCTKHGMTIWKDKKLKRCGPNKKPYQKS